MKEDENQKLKNEKIQNLIRTNKYSSILVAFSIGLLGIIDLPLQLYAKDILKIDPASLSKLTAIIMIPYIIKPFLGILTDLYPLLGYRRKSYLIICSLLIIAMLLIMTFINLTVFSAAIVLFIMNIGISFANLIGEAIIVEISQIETQSNISVQDNAKDYISLFFACRYIGILFSAILKGYLVESIGIKSVFLICSSFCLILFAGGILVVDKKISNQEDEEDYRGNSLIKVNFDEESKILNNLSIETDKKERSLKMPKNKSIMIKEFFSFIGQSYVYIPTIFMVIYISTPSFASPMFYFLSNSLNFTPSEFGLISFASTLLILLSIVIYRLYLKKYDFKIMISIATLASFVVTLIAYFLVKRFNVAWGISDFIMCLACNTLLSGLAEIILLPMLSLGVQLCPKYLEATVYSFFMSTINLGNILSELSGSYLTNLYEITSSNFDNLSKLILVANVVSCVPLIILLFINNRYFHPEENESLVQFEDTFAKEETLINQEDVKFRII